MLAKHGENYHNYIQRTAMFLPGEPGGKIFAALFGWIKSQRRALAVCYVVLLVAGVALAFGSRRYTISQSSIVYLPEKKVIAVSILPRANHSLEQIINDAYELSPVNDALASFLNEGHKGFLVHVMPKNYMMQGLFVQPSESGLRPMKRSSWANVIGFFFPFLRPHSHRAMMGEIEGGEVRLIFSQLTWPNGEYAPPDKALDFTVKHLPLLKTDIDRKNHMADSVEKTSRRNFWGQMPMPVL